MEKNIFLRTLAAGILALAAICAVASAAEEKPAPRQVTLAVFDLDSGGYPGGVGRGVADMMITNLSKSPQFRVYERARLEDVLREQQKGGGWKSDGDPKLRAAQTLGVQFVLLGKVTEFGVSENTVRIPLKGTVTKYKARVALDVRLVQVSDAQVLQTWTAAGSKSDYNLGVNVLGIPDFSFTGREFDESLLGKATRQAVDDICAKIGASFRAGPLSALASELPVEGRVADVEGNNLVLNIGSAAGAEAGMAMDIFRLEKEIKDPETGALLTEKLEPIGELLITHAEENFSEATALSIKPGYTVQVNDRVKEPERKEEGKKATEIQETSDHVH